MNETLTQKIREEAFLLSEKAGHPWGMANQFWLEAERKVLSETPYSQLFGWQIEAAAERAGVTEEQKAKVAEGLGRVFGLIGKLISSARAG